MSFDIDALTEAEQSEYHSLLGNVLRDTTALGNREAIALGMALGALVDLCIDVGKRQAMEGFDEVVVVEEKTCWW